MYFVIIRLTFILILILLINICFNMLSYFAQLSYFYVNVEGDNFVVGDR